MFWGDRQKPVDTKKYLHSLWGDRGYRQEGISVQVGGVTGAVNKKESLYRLWGDRQRL